MRDTIFEAICGACGLDWQNLTKDERGRANAATKQLRDLYGEAEGAVPMMIWERATAYRQVYPEMPLTPQALTGNWSTILNAAEAQRARTKEKVSEQRRETNAHAKSGCQTCGDDHIVSVGTDADGYELTAPCPDCNAHANVAYWINRRKVEAMDPAKTREMMGE
jgi:transcription elongation factor Elf1